MAKNRKIPFGYMMQNGSITTNPKEVIAVITVFQSYLNGESLVDIAKAMEVPYNEGVAWNKNMVKRIIENEKYLGTDKYPQLIDEDTFRRANAKRISKATSLCVISDELQQIRELTFCKECSQKMFRKGGNTRSDKWDCCRKDCYPLDYGSNINLEQMAFRCPNSKVVGTRMIPGYELEFRGVATIVQKEGAEVPVLLWEIDQRDELSLDRYEGFPRMYRKELFEVEVDGKIREGMAYLMNCGEIAPPSPVYYNGIKKGYEANGMDTSYLRAALERAVYHAQHQKQEEDMDEDLDEDFEETDDFQMTFE